MANDDDGDYVEGSADSAPADAPGTIPDDDAPPRGEKANQFGIDSSSVHDAPVLQNRRGTARTMEARKAFAAAILANKEKAAASPPTERDEFDPEAPIPPAVAADVVAAKTAATAAAAPPAPVAAHAPVAPPSPSLDPEVRQLLSSLKADRERFDAERAEWDKSRKASEPKPVEPAGLEDYIEDSPRAYRGWLESMRGEKFASDDEFKREVQDFVTQLSADVLGVPLPDSVRTAFDAAQAKKSVRAFKTIQTKREAAQAARLAQEQTAATEKAEIERVEQEWTKAASALSSQFTPSPDAEGKPQTAAATKTYPWLAAEDEPGKVIVDVIRAQLTKDGTQLSWQEASKRANDYLEGQAKRYFDKRKPLLSAAPAATAAVVASPAKPAVAASPPTPPPTPKKTEREVAGRWSSVEAHRDNTKAAFRAMIAGAKK